MTPEDQVIQLRETLNIVAKAAGDLATSHRALMDEVKDPGPEARAAQWEINQVLHRLEIQDPVDWGYHRRFSSTPAEIHNLLDQGLAQDVHLRYQQRIGDGSVREAVADFRRSISDDPVPEQHRNYSPSDVHELLDLIDPDQSGGPYPSSFLDLGA